MFVHPNNICAMVDTSTLAAYQRILNAFTDLDARVVEDMMHF